MSSMNINIQGDSVTLAADDFFGLVHRESYKAAQIDAVRELTYRASVTPRDIATALDVPIL
jgi:hypothetical protein